MRIHCNLLQASAYSVGLAYELLVLDVLQRYSFQLKHIGGSGDKGQDFIGHWALPTRRIAVVGQCKCYKKPVGPSDVREFEGVLLRKFSHYLSTAIQEAPPSSHCIGIMASHSWFSVSALRTFQSSKVAMMVCQVLTSSGQSHSHNTCTKTDTTELIQNTELGSPNQHGVGSGYINELALNSAAQKLLGNILVSWRMDCNSRRELTVVVSK